MCYVTLNLSMGLETLMEHWRIPLILCNFLGLGATQAQGAVGLEKTNSAQPSISQWTGVF